MSNDTGACPIVPWETQRDQDQQKFWCPIAQQQNYNLQDVFTGGNDPRLNKMMNVEGFSYLAQYRTVPQTDMVQMGPICMAGNCGPQQQNTVSLRQAVPIRSMENYGGMMMQSGNGMMKSRESYSGCGGNGNMMMQKQQVRENYCGCTTRDVMQSGINMMGTR